MMIWTEDEGKRGATEICSSIFKFLSLINLDNCKRIETFSDACGGPNRNKAVICFFMHMCNLFGFDSWEHRYLESGHLYLPNDRDFGMISKSSKNMTVYSVEEWIEIIRKSRKKNPFKVVKMKEDFLNVDQVMKSRKFNNSLSNGVTRFNFLKLKWFKVEKGSNDVEYETSDSSDTCLLNYPLVSDLESVSLEKESRQQKISSNKYHDLMSLMHLVPEEYKSFYTQLSHE